LPSHRLREDSCEATPPAASKAARRGWPKTGRVRPGWNVASSVGLRTCGVVGSRAIQRWAGQLSYPPQSRNPCPPKSGPIVIPGITRVNSLAECFLKCLLSAEGVKNLPSISTVGTLKCAPRRLRPRSLRRVRRGTDPRGHLWSTGESLTEPGLTLHHPSPKGQPRSCQ